jgi:hypothetical protein
MIESNGQSQLQCAQSKPKGRYTGERIPGAKYRAIVDLAAQGRQIDRIAREAGVTRRTAKAVVERESRQIAERKQELKQRLLVGNTMSQLSAPAQSVFESGNAETSMTIPACKAYSAITEWSPS